MYHRYQINFPIDVWDKLVETARKNKRTRKAEILLALEKYLEQQDQAPEQTG